MNSQHYPIISVHIRFDPWRDYHAPPMTAWLEGFGRNRRLDFHGYPENAVPKMLSELEDRWSQTLTLLMKFDLQDAEERQTKIQEAREKMREALKRERGERC